MTRTLHPPSASATRSLHRRLRLIVIADRAHAHPSDVVEVARAALHAGAPALQLREKYLAPRHVLPLAQTLRTLTARSGALFLVNDRIDLALAVAADGVHLGPDDLPVAAARRIASPPFLIGYSTDDPATAQRAVRQGADYIGCGTVYATASKPEAGAPIGLQRLAAVVASVPIPVIGIGGVTADRVPSILETGAVGCAVIGAVMRAPDPHAAVRALLHSASASRPLPD